jgi:hypothetical protein
MSCVLKAERTQWFGMRADGTWSETLHKGFKIREAGENGNDLLLAKLSHGWRVIEVTDRNQFKFEQVILELVELPHEVLQEALRFLEVDHEFQVGPGALLDQLLVA